MGKHVLLPDEGKTARQKPLHTRGAAEFPTPSYPRTILDPVERSIIARLPCIKLLFWLIYVFIDYIYKGRLSCVRTVRNRTNVTGKALNRVEL